MTASTGDTTKESTEQSSFASTSTLNTSQSSTVNSISTASGSSITSSLDATRYTSSLMNVSEMMFSNTTRLQTVLSSVPVSVFTSETDYTTTICHTFPRELFTPVIGETTTTTTTTTTTPMP
ncbi:unnamed protein product, partial [Rotaria sp. Silwood2]